MAFSVAPTYPKKITYGIAVESTYGTAVTNHLGICILDGLLGKPSIDPQPKKYVNRQGLTAQPLMSESIVMTSGSHAVITFSAYVNRYTAGLFWHAFSQYKSGTQYSPFGTHPLTPFSLTFIRGDSTAGRSEIYPGCISSNCKVTAEEGELYKVDVTLSSKTSGTLAQTQNATTWQTSGSNADKYGKIPFVDSPVLLDVGAGDSAIVESMWSLEGSYSEIIYADPDTSGGHAEVLFGLPQATFTCKLLPGSITETLKTRLRNGNYVSMTVSDGGGLTIFGNGQLTSVVEEDETGCPHIIEVECRANSVGGNMYEVDFGC